MGYKRLAQPDFRGEPQAGVFYGALLQYMQKSGLPCAQWYPCICAPGDVGPVLDKVYAGFSALCGEQRAVNSSHHLHAYDAFVAEVRHRCHMRA